MPEFGCHRLHAEHLPVDKLIVNNKQTAFYFDNGLLCICLSILGLVRFIVPGNRPKTLEEFLLLIHQFISALEYIVRTLVLPGTEVRETA